MRKSANVSDTTLLHFLSVDKYLLDAQTGRLWHSPFEYLSGQAQTKVKSFPYPKSKGKYHNSGIEENKNLPIPLLRMKISKSRHKQSQFASYTFHENISEENTLPASHFHLPQKQRVP